MALLFMVIIDLHLFIISIMRIIKLQVETLGDKSIEIQKYAVSLDRKRYSKISHFISYVKKICRLHDQIYQLEYEGFTIPNHDKTQILQEEHVYRLRICQNNCSKKDYQIRSSQLESDEEDAQYETMRKNKNERSNSQRKSKVQQKIQKIVRKKKIVQSSLSDSEQQSDSSLSQLEEESSSSQSSQSSSEPKRKTKTNYNSKVVVQTQVKKTAPRPLTKKQLPIEQVKVVKQTNKKNPFIQRKVDSSPSSSSSSQLQNVPIKQLKNKPSAKITKANDNLKQVQVSKNNSQIPLKNIKKAIIPDSSSQSQPSQTPPVKKPPPIISTITHETTKKVQQNTENASIDKPKSDLKLPPALRNKIVKKNFDQHKESQWIAIDKQNLKRWQQAGNKTVCQVNNKIRFKIVELDQQKFIPVKSGWITGEVKGVEVSGVINLGKVQQQGKPYQQKYDIPEHNMDQLQLNRLLATKEQIQFFSHKQKENQQQQSQLQNKPQPTEEKPVQKNEQATNDKNSLQKYICGQANYYFSDKNYNFDLFMQMHANRHPQKYLNLGILLNFPKIKKVLHDKQKLYQYLKEDQKYEQRTYEIDFQNQLIRKKGIHVQPIKQNKPEDGQVDQQNGAQFANKRQ